MRCYLLTVYRLCVAGAGLQSTGRLSAVCHHNPEPRLSVVTGTRSAACDWRLGTCVLLETSVPACWACHRVVAACWLGSCWQTWSVLDEGCNCELWTRWTVMPSSHRRHRQDKTGDKTRQFCLVSTQFPIWVLSCFHFATVLSYIYWGLLKTYKLETGSRQDKTVLSCHQFWFTPLTQTRQFCRVRVGGVNCL